MSSDTTVVVGGGIIGLACAYELVSAGQPVYVLDRSRIGAGSSGGNAGWVTLSQCFPVPSPDSVRTALRSIGRAEAPLYVRPTLSPSFLRWFYDFRSFCNRSAFLRGTRALARLADQAVPHYEKWQRDGIDTSLTTPGLIHAFLEDREALRTLATQRLVSNGRFSVPAHPLSGPGITELEPALQGQDVRSVYLIEHDSLVDPGRLLSSLSQRLHALDVQIDQGRTVTGFDARHGRVRGVIVDGDLLNCGRVIIASGTWSGQALGWLGTSLRMQAGKGYSFSVELPTPPAHPLYLGDKHVAVSPIGSATRIAGTMEFSGNNLRLDWRRVEAIARASRHYLGDWFRSNDELMGRIADPWVGGRPMVPDGLPIIDQVPGTENAYVATAHGMLGMTLAPATASNLVDYITTGSKPEDLLPFGFHRSRRMTN
jgi:glycine/D-amino acid oxidase-like deaminating enzyme